MTSILLLLALAANEYPVEIVRVKDGDTFVANVQMDFQITLSQQEIRISDFDAWETSRRRKTVHVTGEELLKGKIATAALEELFRNSRRILVVPQRPLRDAYGRLLLQVIVEDKQGKRTGVGDYMRAHGHQRGKE